MYKTITGFLLMTFFLSTQVKAMTVYSGLQGVVIEDSSTLLPSGLFPSYTVGDFKKKPNKTVLQFAGEASVFGTVKQCCYDAFTIDLQDKTADLVFQAWAGPPGYQLGLAVSGLGVSYLATTLDTWSSPIRLNQLTGQIRVVFSGDNKKVNWRTDVEITELSSVPLPPAVGLFLAGLFTLGAISSKGSKKPSS